jgi:DNA-3-methyladenine glycosylase II
MPTQKHTKHLAKADPVLAAVMKKIKLQELKLRDNYFHALIRAIAGQQLSMKAAATILGRVEALFPGKKLPAPKKFLEVSDEKLRAAGFSTGKVQYTKNIARFFIEREKELKKIHELSDEDIIKLLTQIKGVGIWTVEMFLMFSLGREDVFSYGDLGLRKGLQKVYGFKKEPSLKQMQKIVDKWKPYRTHGARYMWASLVEGKKKS